MKQTFQDLNRTIIECTRCPRLVAFRETVPLAKRYQHQIGWRRPIPGFGDPEGELLLLGLAPAAQGGNRTGRIFTGDETGRFLMSALYQAGFSNQPFTESREDNLKLFNCYLTASVKCVPPANKPLPSEVANCSSYLDAEFFLLKNLKAVLALGKLAFDVYVRFLKKHSAPVQASSFAHGKKIEVSGWPTLFGSYHPSPQNTYTGKLTSEMLLSLLIKIKKETLTKSK